jgi:ubiquinone/menaquinone biosynthesis C-methylase UbiE
VGFYVEKVLPRIQDKVMDRKPLRPLRERACAGLHGDVVEVGFGTGLNAPCYPDAVHKVFAVEPSALSMRLAQPRIARSPAPVELAALTGEELDLPSDEFEVALSTWTLCTIPDVGKALAELRRVLEPGGTFHFVEHGLAPDADVARWQRRLEPIQKRIGGGCHLTRDIGALIEDAGFELEQLDTYYLKGQPKFLGYMYEGRALKA